MEISFQSVERADFHQLRKWLAEPHVKLWWHDSPSAADIEKKYGPRVDGVEPTHVFLILYRGRSIGLIQYYLWSDYPDHAIQLRADKGSAGIDLAIGDKEMVGKGLGPKIISEFLHQVVFDRTDTTSVITDPEKENLQSIKAFEKAGFQILRTVRLKDETHERFVVGFEKQPVQTN